MPRYLFKASYSVEALRGLFKDGGSGRADAVRKTIESAGGHVESFYFAFGEDDAYLVCELPDNSTAAAVSLTIGAGGYVTTKTVVLLAPDEIDNATQMTIEYRAPGR
jgi:uncharacterized protein with GYD domain